MAFFQGGLAIDRNKTIIVYPDQSIEQLSPPPGRDTLMLHIAKLIGLHGIEAKGADYYIAFPWVDQGDLMLDLWIFSQTETYKSGPVTDVMVFRNEAVETGLGIGCVNALRVLGLEATFRREARDLKQYLNTLPRPALPPNLIAQAAVQL